MGRTVPVGNASDKQLHHMMCPCARCERAARTPHGEIEAILSILAGAPVAICAWPGASLRAGLTLDGATSRLAALSGFKHPNGRCYFTGPKILRLLSMEVST